MKKLHKDFFNAKTPKRQNGAVLLQEHKSIVFT